MQAISEFKNRKIGSTLVVYLGGGWVVIEAFNFITEKYQWPAASLDIIILLVIFGLPSVLIHTWYHRKIGKQKFSKKEFFLHGINGLLFSFLIARLLMAGDFSIKKDISSERSIAVLPFKNLSTDKENQFFVDGVIEEVRNHLGKINELWVTSGNSTEHYRNSSKSGLQIADELGVSFMLSGSIQKYENNIRINVELSDIKQNKQIWTEVFDRKYEDIFELQSDIAIKIATQLNMKLSPQETSIITKKHTGNLRAYELYLKGKGLIRNEGRTFKDLDKAAKIFKEAIELEPDFSLAYVGLASTYLSHIMWGRSSPKEIIPLAQEAIMKAMEIDNSMGESYQILGQIKFYQTDFKAAETYLLKAIELNSSYVESYVWLANLYLITNKETESFKMYDKAISLDPSAVNYRFLKAYAHYQIRDYETGIIEVESETEFIEDTEIQWVLGCLYFGKGDYEKSINYYKNRTSAPSTNWALGYVYGITGKTDSARYILNYLLDKREKQYVPGYVISCVYVSLGEYDNAIKWLQTAYEDGPDLLFFMGILHDKRLDPITHDPRLIELREKIKSPNK